VITVRAVRASEAAPLRELRLRVLTDSPAAFATTAEEEALRPDSDWSELAAVSDLGEDGVVFVAIDDGRWVGIAAGRWFDRDRGIAHLWSMWVDPSARRHGLGERLVAAVRGWANGHGARFLRLGVVAGESDASRFYEHLGFVRTGETRTLERDPTRGAFFLVRPV
jgi:GNAT superfamily N-acetyltransferase